MDRDLRQRDLSDAVERRRRRRQLMNDVRRKVERDWVLSPPAEDLAREVEAVLKMIDAGPAGLDPTRFAALRAALAKFRSLQ